MLLGFNLALGQANGFCTLAWSDEFNTLSSDWTKEQTCYGGGNNEMECYTARPKNVFIDNGVLVLRAYRETYTGSQSGCTDSQGCTWTKPYTSGKVNTAASRSFLYGRFEIRAKLPSGYQLWPAIWMMPTDYAYGGWAASGEIDIMEARGNNPWVASGTLHHGGQWPNNVYTTTGDHGIGVDLSLDYHVYALEWTSSSMNWYIDNTLTQSYSLNRWWSSSAQGVYSAMGQPFDRRFHFILNLAVGGGFFGGAAPVTDAQAAAWAQPEMRVDYVRVWNQGGNCGAAQTPSPQTSAQIPTTSRANQASTSSQANDQPNRPTSGAAGGATCNTQVYDPSMYTCTVNDQGSQVLCQTGFQSCGAACYSPQQYCCSNGALRAKSLCPANAVPTTTVATTATTTQTTATTSATTQATATTALAPANANQGTSNTCNGQIYNTAQYSCTTNEQGRTVLCLVGYSSCGNSCYSPTQYCCKNGVLTQKSFC
jgi:beta-glucanase (GH16 family)